MTMKNDNKGFSLVELIVAISVGTIISAAIGSIIIYAIRMYRNETVRVNLQYEVQTNMNQVRDSIMSANWMKISDASGVTSYASFGNIKDAAGSWNYDGVVLVCSKSEVIEADGSSHPSEYYSIYMDRVSYTTGQNISEIESKIDETVGNITSATGNDKLVYLLGEHVKSFVLKPSQGCIDDTEHKYTNPFAIDVLIEFEDKNWQRENIDKRVEETVYMRNQVSQDILYNGNSYVYDK